MIPKHDVFWIEKGFNVLWEDSLDAVAHSYWYEMPWVARLAMLNTIFSAEAAANCCIASLFPGTNPPKKIDRLKTVEKFDYYLRQTKNSPLNMSAPQVAALADAFQLRNSIVHRRQARAKLVKRRFRREVEFFPVLNIKRNPEHWDSDTAKSILLTISEFFEYFFVGCCGQTPEQTYALLQDIIEQPTAGDSGPIHENGWYPSALKVLLDKKAICPKWVAHLHQELEGPAD